MKKGLIVFAREPLPGKVKTRLAASVGDQIAADLYEDMLQAVLAATRKLDDVETVVYWACEEEALPRLAEKYHCSSRSQKIGDLGQRMLAAFEAMFAGGCQLCCIIGSDAPDMPRSYIREAYQLLATQQTDTVFGPSKDGGYYLLGMKQVWPRLFRDIPWSSEDVLKKSLIIALDAGLTTALLPEWQDIDTVEDLQAFQNRTSGKS
jgi:rSAM/selenodomain-associated transferase 1